MADGGLTSYGKPARSVVFPELSEASQSNDIWLYTRMRIICDHGDGGAADHGPTSAWALPAGGEAAAG